MTVSKLSGKPSNRRLASRIYDQVNLYYHPIDAGLISRFKLDFDTLLNGAVISESAANAAGNGTAPIENSLPDSLSQQKDTLNVNISASGIAFTCQEKLLPGDYLMLRILLLSSMTLVMTCCKVVYCKPSNPYETGQYPFLVGAQFVNLTEADKTLLEDYVRRKRRRQFLSNGLLAVSILSLISFPEEVLGLLWEMGDYLWEQLLEINDIAMDSLALGIEFFLEKTFHTSPHNIQIIGFYIEMAVQIAAGYLLLRMFWIGFRRWSAQLAASFARKKASWLFYWHEQSALYKVGAIGAGILALSGYVFLFL